MQVIARAFRETHHATVLENWGLLWMWHSLALLTTCLLTNLLQWTGATSPVFLSRFVDGRAGNVGRDFLDPTPAGRAGDIRRAADRARVGREYDDQHRRVVLRRDDLGLPVLTLSPVLGLVGGMVFVVKAGTLSGQFYFQAAALFATALGMALLQRLQIQLGLTLFGVVSAACFFLPGLKYYRQRESADVV